MNACLTLVETAPLTFDRQGHLYVSDGGILYRVRYYAEEEWAALASDSRPVACFYDPELASWVSLEPALPSEDLWRSTP